MKTLIILSAGFIMGLGLMFFIRLKLGDGMYCPRCTKTYLVRRNKKNPVCKICGVPLKLYPKGNKR